MKQNLCYIFLGILILSLVSCSLKQKQAIETSPVQSEVKEANPVNIISDPARNTFWIGITSTPSNARIFIDGAYTGFDTYSKLELSRGEHLISIRKDGYRWFEKKYTVDRGISIAITLIKQ